MPSQARSSSGSMAWYAGQRRATRRMRRRSQAVADGNGQAGSLRRRDTAGASSAAQAPGAVVVGPNTESCDGFGGANRISPIAYGELPRTAGESMEKDEQPGRAAPSAERLDPPRAAALSRDTRILFGTLVVGFLGVIVTLVIGVYRESRADRRAGVNLESTTLLSRLDEASRDRAEIRQGIAAIRETMQAGFDAAVQDRAAIRSEMRAGFDAAVQDRAAIREEMWTIREEAAQGRAAIRETMRDQTEALNGSLLLAALCLIDEVRHQSASGAADADGPAVENRPAFPSATCEQLEIRAATVR